MSRPPPLRHVGTGKTVVDDGAGMPGMAPPTDDGGGFFHPALEHPSLDMALDVEWDQMEMEEGAAAVDGGGWDYPPEPEEGGVVDDMDHEDPAGQDDDAQNETREVCSIRISFERVPRLHALCSARRSNHLSDQQLLPQLLLLRHQRDPPASSAFSCPLPRFFLR